jgi:hypothetical protein
MVFSLLEGKEKFLPISSHNNQSEKVSSQGSVVLVPGSNLQAKREN